MFVRVRDPETGHEFDVLEGGRLLRLGLVAPVKGVEPAAHQRAPKHATERAGRPARRQPKSSGAGGNQKKESRHD